MLCNEHKESMNNANLPDMKRTTNTLSVSGQGIVMRVAFELMIVRFVLNLAAKTLNAFSPSFVLSEQRFLLVLRNFSSELGEILFRIVHLMQRILRHLLQMRHIVGSIVPFGHRHFSLPSVDKR
jgi:hypothetical protein